MKLSMSISLAVFSGLPGALFAWYKDLPQLPPPVYEDTEVVTNIPFNTGSANQRLWKLVMSVDAGASNCVEVAFGVDADADGTLGVEEWELAVGWDCGEWFLRDRRTGAVERTSRNEGRRRLAWSVYLDADRSGGTLVADDGSPVFPAYVRPGFFNTSWNVARIMRRGVQPADEVVSIGVSKVGFAIFVK